MPGVRALTAAGGALRGGVAMPRPAASVPGVYASRP